MTPSSPDGAAPDAPNGALDSALVTELLVRCALQQRAIETLQGAVRDLRATVGGHDGVLTALARENEDLQAKLEVAGDLLLDSMRAEDRARVELQALQAQIDADRESSLASDYRAELMRDLARDD